MGKSEGIGGYRKTADSRERDIRLKVLAYNAMILEALPERIETGQESSFQKK